MIDSKSFVRYVYIHLEYPFADEINVCCFSISNTCVLVLAGEQSESVVELPLDSDVYIGNRQYDHITVNPRTIDYISRCAKGRQQ